MPPSEDERILTADEQFTSLSIKVNNIKATCEQTLSADAADHTIGSADQMVSHTCKEEAGLTLAQKIASLTILSKQLNEFKGRSNDEAEILFAKFLAEDVEDSFVECETPTPASASSRTMSASMAGSDSAQGSGNEPEDIAAFIAASQRPGEEPILWISRRAHEGAMRNLADIGRRLAGEK